MFFFFFSSRRRHTRWPRDWSSDVCSSDLDAKSFHYGDQVGSKALRETLASYLRAARSLRCEAEQVMITSGDRKSTRLNSSHVAISYAVFCLQKTKLAVKHFHCSLGTLISS